MILGFLDCLLVFLLGVGGTHCVLWWKKFGFFLVTPNKGSFKWLAECKFDQCTNSPNLAPAAAAAMQHADLADWRCALSWPLLLL